MDLIIAANWKMHKTRGEAIAFCRALCRHEENFTGVEVLVCPPFTALGAVAEALAMENSAVGIGAQNMHWEDSGAFTGEISASMLLDAGARYVIIGHSERRHLFGEDDTMVNRKMKAALASGLKPILCVGETEEERERGVTAEVVTAQLSGALEGFNTDQAEGLVVAYEPVWAIGTGKAASPNDAADAADLITSFFLDRFGSGAAATLRIQYGGSVKADNIGSYVSMPAVQGALVGGASLEAASFSALIQSAREAVAR